MRTTRPTTRQACANCALAAMTFAVCAALMTAAVLAHAPMTALPLLVLVCIGCPAVMACTLPRSIAVVRAARRRRRMDGDEALAALRRNLASLPETKHPLGL